MQEQRNEKVINKILKSGQKYLIIAQAGVGKSTAANIYPKLIADVDPFLMRRMPNTPPPPAPMIRNPQFPVNYLRALIKAFETHPIILSSIKGNWEIEPSASIIPLLPRTFDTALIKEYIRYTTGINIRASQHGEFTETPEFNTEIEKLTKEMQPLIELLCKINFKPVLVMPDKDCFTSFIANIKNRKATPGQEFRGNKRETEAQNEVAKSLENFYNTGLFLKMPMHKGQYFIDAFNDAILNDKFT